MKLSFAGLDHSIAFNAKHVVVVQISSKALFARICQSLLSGKGESAVEPYSIWDDEGQEVTSSKAFIPIINPFDLPWKHKSLMGMIPKQIEGILLQDENQRTELQALGSELESAIARIGFQLNADYAFKIEWMLGNHLKAFGFDIDVPEGASLLDNLIQLIDLAADANINETLLFVNLKTFLLKTELIELYSRLNFREIKAILLENQEAEASGEFEQKVVIDRDFIEYQVVGRLEDPSLSQGRICSNGFGAVTF